MICHRDVRNMDENEETEMLIFPKKQLQQPDLSIGNFQLWVHGRQFPDCEDDWDANWLQATARCAEESAIVQVQGSILHLSELHQWIVECKRIYTSLSGEAHLKCMEPNLSLKITMQNRGRCELSVHITPDHLYQQHEFIFDLDQSYLLSFIKNLELLLQNYPLKGVK